MSRTHFRMVLGTALIGLMAWAPGGAALAQTRPSPDQFCAATGARDYQFDKGLGPDWVVSVRPMKSPTTPYPDGSIDGDTTGNVQTGGGMLHLMARRVGDGFTGSRLLSRRPIRFGCVEIVARLPRGRGFWPALWMRTPYDGSPINGEIDLMEGFGSHPGVFVSTLHHWRKGVDADGTHRRIVAGVDRTYTCARVVADTPRSEIATRMALAEAKLAGAERGKLSNWLFAHYQNPCAIVTVAKNTDFAAGFHRYTIVWTPDRLVWMLDGRPFFATADDIPQVAMMIVMGLGVGSLDGGADVGTPPSGDLQVKSVQIMDMVRK